MEVERGEGGDDSEDEMIGPPIPSGYQVRLLMSCMFLGLTLPLSYRTTVLQVKKTRTVVMKMPIRWKMMM